MKRFSKLKVVLSAALLLVGFGTMYAQTADEPDTYELTNLISTITSVQAPFVTDKFIVFTQQNGPRFAGIAFDFEGYRVIHPFQIKNTRDFEENITSSLLFFVLDRPKDKTEITYRLIIDGLWTADPLNPNRFFDEDTGVSLSRLDLGGMLPEVTGTKAQHITKFIYNGEPGQTVRLGGTFTNWDSLIYELEEKEPGLYELELPLPKGTYYYNYFLGMTAITDKTNPRKSWSDEGRVTSVIEVE